MWDKKNRKKEENPCGGVNKTKQTWNDKGLWEGEEGGGLGAGLRMSHQRHWGGIAAMPWRMVQPVAIQISCGNHTHTHTHKRRQREGKVRTTEPQRTVLTHTHADTHTQRWTTIAPVKRVETYSPHTVDGPLWSQYCDGNQHRVHDHDYYKHTFRQHKHRPFRLCLVLEQFSLVARPNQAPHSCS